MAESYVHDRWSPIIRSLRCHEGFAEPVGWAFSESKTLYRPLPRHEFPRAWIKLSYSPRRMFRTTASILPPGEQRLTSADNLYWSFLSRAAQDAKMGNPVAKFQFVCRGDKSMILNLRQLPLFETRLRYWVYKHLSSSIKSSRTITSNSSCNRSKRRSLVIKAPAP